MPDLEFKASWLIARAAEAAGQGDLASARDWLDLLDPTARPKDLEGTVHYGRARVAISDGDWVLAETEMRAATAADGAGLYQRRLELIRRRAHLLADREYELISEKLDQAVTLRPDMIAPLARQVWACGAYISRGQEWKHAWTRVVREAKYPEREQHDGALGLIPSFFVRRLAETTDCLRSVDVVVSIPAKPSHFVERGESLPDRLAKTLEREAALPWEFRALEWTGAEVTLRGMGRAERREAVAGTMSVGKLGLAEGRVVLLVDDVVTSGATCREAARVLKEAGAADVYAAALAHTEG